jgi:DNA polymerase-3 subunit epsilon
MDGVSSYLFGQPLAIVDVETTGMSAAYGRIIEIGVLRIEAGHLVQEYSTLVDPQAHIPYVITQLTGITDAGVVGAPTFGAIAAEVYGLLEGCILVAHNARFDYGFIREELKRAGFAYTAQTLCSVRLSRLIYPALAAHSLGYLIEHFGFSFTARHRALDDARVVWQYLQHMQRKVAPAVLDGYIRSILQRPCIPPNLGAADIEALPHSPGVYLFYDGQGALLYIGKANDIRSRVMEHFSGQGRSATEQKIFQQVTHIETQTTGSELTALLLEAHLIKTKLPLYNRQARLSRRLVGLVQKETHLGYQRISIEPVDTRSFEPSDNILGLFKSKQQAKACLHSIAEELRLCPKLLGLESGTGDACFNYPLKACEGACVQAQRPELFNAKLQAAFVQRRLKAWPYAGPVLFAAVTTAKPQVIGAVFLIDQWCLLKAYRVLEGVPSPLFAADYGFDFDAYKLLSRAIAQGRLRPLSAQERAVLFSESGGGSFEEANLAKSMHT